MKKIIILFVLLFSLSAYADIIITKSNGNIEDVTIVEITDTEVIYTQRGTRKSIPYENVEAILYDDGRYVTLPSKSQTYSNSENNTSLSKDSYSRIPKDVDRQKVNENNEEKMREYEEKERKIVNENNSDKKRELEKEREELKEKAKEFKNAWRDYFQKVKEAFKIKQTDSNTKDSPSSQPDSDNNW